MSKNPDFTLLRPWLAEGRRHPREDGEPDRVIILPVIRIENRTARSGGIDDSDTARANTYLAGKRRRPIGKRCADCVGTGRGSATDPSLACASCEGVGVVSNDDPGPDRCYTPTPPSDPLTQGITGKAIDTPAVRMGRELEEHLAHVLMNEFDMRIGSGAAKCFNVAREVLDRFATAPAITRPGPPDTTLYLQRDMVRATIIAHLGEVPAIATTVLATIDKLAIVTAGELRDPRFTCKARHPGTPEPQEPAPIEREPR